MLNSIARIFIVLAGLMLAIEAFWYSSQPEQRRALLIQLGRDDMAHWFETDQHQPLLLQVWSMKQLESVYLQQAQQREFQHQQDETGQQGPARQDDQNTIAQVQAIASGWKHKVGQTVCGKPKTQALDNVKTQTIYKWVDANGQVHYGEKTTAANAQDLSKQYGTSTRSVQLSMEYPGWAGDNILAKEIDRQGKLVHKVLGHYIPREYQRQINLKIVLFKDVASFEAHRDKQQANAFWGAYYSSGNNTIYLPRYPQLAQTMAIARHEMTHAMVAGMLGRLPVWLNEGLAEYMESFRWQMNAAIAEPNIGSYQQLEGTDLKWLVNTDHREFYGDGHALNYRQAAAAVYFLLDHQAGRHWMKGTFKRFAENPCGQQFARNLFADYYPGGLDVAAQSWKSWLKKGKFPSHRY